MAKVRFFSQKMIEDWSSQGKVDFDGQKLTIKVGEGGVYELSPATRFLEATEGQDQRALKGKVLNKQHLQDLGADVYLDSAIVGEVVYKVEPGFIVAKILSPGAGGVRTQAKKAAASPDEKKSAVDLADLVLKALSD